MKLIGNALNQCITLKLRYAMKKDTFQQNIITYLSSFVVLFLILSSCANQTKTKSSEKNRMNPDYKKGQYGFDLQFLSSHLKPVELINGESRILVVPEYQGRVMTSTSSGLNGFSYGWINHGLIDEGAVHPHINAYGGEERLWFGPEGGQFSIFFKEDDPFDTDHWQTPACIDTEAFEIYNQDSGSVAFTKNILLSNYSGSKFNFNVFREVRLLNRENLMKNLSIEIPKSVKVVAYRSNNRIKNIGNNEWEKSTGTISIWMLGMLNPSPEVIVVIPYKKGDYGAIVNSDYFGEVPKERLQISDGVIFFKADGKYRSKIGVSALRALPLIGSYDAKNKILTVLECTIDESAKEYVNSAWEIQKDPFAGDVINSYNDGPMEDGSQMGPFYELESSSKAAFLKPGEELSHSQVTYHFEGDEGELNLISEKILGVSIREVKKSFD